MTGASPCTVNEMMMMKILTDPKLGPSEKYIINLVCNDAINTLTRVL